MREMDLEVVMPVRDLKRLFWTLVILLGVWLTFPPIITGLIFMIAGGWNIPNRELKGEADDA